MSAALNSSNARGRHIAFANRVEQCIAVDNEEDRERYGSRLSAANTTPRWGTRVQGRTASYFQHRSSSSEDDEAIGDDSSDDDDSKVLTFRSSRQTIYPPAQSPVLPTNDQHCTIAKLAPTVLKSSESLPVPSPPVIYSPEVQRSALPSEPTAGESSQHYSRPASQPMQGSAPPVVAGVQDSAPVKSSPLAHEPDNVRSSWSSFDSVSQEDLNSGLHGYGVSDDAGDYALNEPIVAPESSSEKAALPSANLNNGGQQSKTPPGVGVPAKSILKKTAQPDQSLHAVAAAVVTGSETDDTSESSSSGSTLSVSSSSESGNTLPLSSHAPSAASDALKAELESRGRPVARTSSGSSLDGRSASRQPSGGSAGSVSPTTFPDAAMYGSQGQPNRSPTKTRLKAEDAASLAEAQSLKGSGEDLMRPNPRLEDDAPSSRGAGPNTLSGVQGSHLIPSVPEDSSLTRLADPLPQFGERLQDASVLSQALEAVHTSCDVVRHCGRYVCMPCTDADFMDVGR